MSKREVEFVTYCIGNLSERLGRSQTEIYNLLARSGILQDYIEDLIGYMREKKLVA